MTQTSLLYVSRSLIPPDAQAVEAERIVEVAQRRNRLLDVTGALVFTERHCAQNLEGPEPAVAELMESITRDPRHEDVRVVYREQLPDRNFATWAMAYSGPSTFVTGYVGLVLARTDPAGRRRAAERLIALMRQFVEAQQIERSRNAGQV